MASTSLGRLLSRRSKAPLSLCISIKRFSTSQPNLSLEDPADTAKPSNLSARLSFIFDQIDAIQRERPEKDETLQRIRAWREKKEEEKASKSGLTKSEPTRWKIGSENLRKEEADPGMPEFKLSDSDSAKLSPTDGREVASSDFAGENTEGLTQSDHKRTTLIKKVDLVHPWPEWLELMERLVQQNYFDHRRKDEDKMIKDLGFDPSEVADEGFDFTRDWKTVQTAGLNFGRDRFDILRSLSRQDIQILVGYGCPSADKKVVFSAKLLRKHVHLDEGDVCSSCCLRSSCEKAFLLTNKEDEARTFDVMRILLTYGFDPIDGSVVNKSLLKQKSVKTVVRKLLHEVVKLSAVPIDPNLPPPVIKKPPPKVKQPPPPPKKRVGRDDVEMKKGDWLCPKCDFMNFAKNTVCLQCDAKRPKRQVLPGEWECPECNFLNYRRNVVCFHCECKRPPDEYTENQMQEKQRGPRTRLEEKAVSRSDVSNAWNFNFDDDESDGADVASFEHADLSRASEELPSDLHNQKGKFRGYEETTNRHRGGGGGGGGGYYEEATNKAGEGFDDFDDEEDDIDNYEIDTKENNPVRVPFSNNFSRAEEFSELEDAESFNRNLPSRGSSSRSKSRRQSSKFLGSEDELDFDPDEELSTRPRWKSSHVSDRRDARGPSKRLSYGSDEELGLGSATEDEANGDFESMERNGGDWSSSSRRDSSNKRGNLGTKGDTPFYGSEFGDETHSPRDGRRAGKASGGGGRNFATGYRSSARRGGGMNSRGGDFNTGTFSRSDGDYRGRRGDDFGGRRMNERSNGDWRETKGNRREGFGNRERGRYNNRDTRSDARLGFEDDRPRRRRIIER